MANATDARAHDDSTAEDGRLAWDAWRAERRVAVTAAQGSLALVETRWFVGSESNSPGSIEAEDALANQPETLTVSKIERRNIDTAVPERGIRLWDARSPGIRTFETITAFAFDPAWIINATFNPVNSTRTIPFEHIRDNGGTRNLVVPGDITFSFRGIDHTLSAFDDGGTLLLVFGDETNGSADAALRTYGSGRFLFVQHDEEAGVGDPGQVTLDFNRAFVPPCGFSDQYNCPLPPRENRFSFPITAGECEVVFRQRP